MLTLLGTCVCQRSVAATLFREPEEDNDYHRVVTDGGNSGHHKKQLMRDSPSLSLLDTPESSTAMRRVLLQQYWPCKGLGMKGGGEKRLYPTRTLTPIFHLIRLPAPGLAGGPVAALQTVIHQACRLAQVFLIRAPSGLLHPGGCL